MLRTMERKIGNYKVEINGYVCDWIWHLTPCVQLSFDEVFFGIQISFLCFNLMIDLTNEKKFAEWSERIDEKFGSETEKD